MTTIKFQITVPVDNVWLGNDFVILIYKKKLGLLQFPDTLEDKVHMLGRLNESWQKELW